MSRLFRGARQLHFLTRRTIPRIANRQEVVVHHVKMKRRTFGGFMTRICLRTLAVVFVVETYNYLVLEPLVRAAEELPTVEMEDDESDETFIALPLTNSIHNPPPYSRNDPEWAEFIRINKDKELIQRMRETLNSIVLKAVQNNRQSVQRFGKATKTQGSVLDLEYPLRPPPVHRQLGILINNEVVAIASRERDSYSAQLEERILWPKTVALSTWALLTTSLSETKESLHKALFGGTTDGPIVRGNLSDPPAAIASATSKPNDVQKAMQAIREIATRRPGELPSSDTSMTSSADKPASKATGGSSGASNSSSPSPTGPTADSNPEGAPKPFTAGTRAFLETLFKTNRSIRTFPPRGCVAVTGMVVVDTPKAWLHIDVVAFWNPKENAYDLDSMLLGLRNARAKVVSPLR